MIDRYTDDYETFYKTLYDKKIPSFMKKLANQYGGKFEDGKLDHRDTYTKFAPLTSNEQKNLESTIIKITPEMKAKILEEGLPTFKRGGEVRSSLYDIDIFGAEMR